MPDQPLGAQMGAAQSNHRARFNCLASARLWRMCLPSSIQPAKLVFVRHTAYLPVIIHPSLNWEKSGDKGGEMRTTIRRRAAGSVGGALLGVVAGLLSPTVASAEAPLFSGSYSIAPHGDVVRVSSDCGGCDATMSGAVGSTVVKWTGAGWQGVSTDQCGPLTGTFVPAVVAGGVVQEMAYTATGGCVGTLSTVWTRIGA